MSSAGAGPSPAPSIAARGPRRPGPRASGRSLAAARCARTTSRSQHSSRSRLTQADSHQVTGWKKSSDSASRCNRVMRLSCRRMWASSCSRAISTCSMVQPPSAAGGRRIIGRTTPTRTGAAIRSQIATPTRRATPSAVGQRPAVARRSHRPPAAGSSAAAVRRRPGRWRAGRASPASRTARRRAGSRPAARTGRRRGTRGAAAADSTPGRRRSGVRRAGRIGRSPVRPAGGRAPARREDRLRRGIGPVEPGEEDDGRGRQGQQAGDGHSVADLRPRRAEEPSQHGGGQAARGADPDEVEHGPAGRGPGGERPRWCMGSSPASFRRRGARGGLRAGRGSRRGRDRRGRLPGSGGRPGAGPSRRRRAGRPCRAGPWRWTRGWPRPTRRSRAGRPAARPAPWPASSSSVVAIVVSATWRRPWIAAWIGPSPAGPCSQRTFRISSSASVGCALGGRAMGSSFFARLLEAYRLANRMRFLQKS